MEKSVIQNIVKASGIKPNELILVQFWGEDKDIEIMHKFSSAVTSLGASPIEMQQSRTVNTERFTVGTESSFSDNYFNLLSSFDAVLDIFCYQPVILGNKLNETQTKIYKKYMSSLFNALMKSKRFTQIRIPTYENALETNMTPEEYITRLNSAYDIDYVKLQHEGNQRISELSSKTVITLITDGRNRLCFNLSDRKWHLDAGDGDMPCGEIYIAPLEHETNGTVYFDKLYAKDLGEYNNVTLTVENGIITSTNNDDLNKHFADLNAEDKTVCELGFGLNPNIKTLCGYTLLDEKAYGTFHIAIGANTMFGGVNSSSIHIDFVGMANIE